MAKPQNGRQLRLGSLRDLFWAHCCSCCMSMTLGRKFTHTLGFLPMIVPSFTSSHMEALQNDLHRLYEWSQKWQLNLNLTKCKAICISNKCSPPFHKYAINNVLLDWVDTFKYLGVTVGCNLKWKDQVLTSAAKATKVLNLLRRNMFHCSKAKKEHFWLLFVPSLNMQRQYGHHTT